MKIIYLHQYFNTPAMNGSTRSYEMARRFVQAGHEVHIISSCRDSDLSRNQWWIEMVEGIHVHWLSVPYSNKLSYTQRIKAFVYFAWEAAKKAYQVGGDVIFATSTPLTIALPGIYASGRLKIPMIFEVRDLWPELPITVGALKNPLLIFVAKWLEKLAYRHSSHIVALSPGMAVGIQKTGYPAKQISVIPNGADIALFQGDEIVEDAFLEKHPQLSGAPLIVYAGTLGIINGVGYLVDIALEMQSIDPAVNFLIVGDGKECSLIKEKARNHGILENNLWMLPPKPKSEMPGLLAASTVATSFFIDLPEMWNNSANKFFDALAAGKPIMINYKGWQADMIEKSQAGIVVPPDKPKKAATILHNFLYNEQRVKEAENAARQLALQHFDRDELADKLLVVLKKCQAEAGNELF